jgi:uncharacterized protein involved in exopolysaccharide biosynthesis
MRSLEGGTGAGGRTTPRGEIGSVLARRKWQILIVFVLIVAAVATVTFMMPKQYETHMKILVRNERANMIVSAGLNAQSPPREVTEAEINTEIELLNNNDLLSEVVAACGLAKLENTDGTPPAQRQQVALGNAVRRLRHDLTISPVRKADIIEVDYTAPNPHQALAVLRQLAASYLEAHLRLHGSPGTHEFFLKQTAHYQNLLRDAETKLTDFRGRNDIVLFAQQKEDILRRTSESSSMLLATEASVRESLRKIAEARTQLASVAPRVITQSRTVSNQSSVERLSTMLVELQNKRTLLLSKYRSDDRLVEEVSQEIADTQAALENAKNLKGSDQATDINPVRQTLELNIAREQSEVAGLEARRQALAQQIQSYRQQVSRLGGSTAEYDDLMRSQKEAEDNYLLYARKTEEARIADSLDQQKIANVAIAENPVEPYLPSKPDVGRNLFLGTLLAAFLSLGMAFSREYLDQPLPLVETDARGAVGAARDTLPLPETIEQAAEIEALTGLPVLATAHRLRSQLQVRAWLDSLAGSSGQKYQK